MKRTASANNTALSFALHCIRYERNRLHLEADLAHVHAQLDKLLRENDIQGRTHGRVKSLLSTWQKMEGGRRSMHDVHDLLGLRVVVNRVSECYRVANMLRSAFPGACLLRRNYVEQPKSNGYRSLHVVVRPADKKCFEVQIRTTEMDADSVHGSSSHRLYKQIRSSAQPGEGRTPNNEDSVPR